ncbi:WhiB family transcriptional regulator [Saccharopolyspora cebuensis]|uniref:WhiB family transcriptional regulator n=1 Tax=Saccharopolyspora cebuensis TaxID=418759 RepID=A0ABV4CQX4_9PSEU
MNDHWIHRAACVGTMLELWFGPDHYTEPRDQQRWRQRRAAEVCATCPVRTDCLAEELARPLSEQHGIRGGLTPRARERLLAQWRAEGLIPEHSPTGDTHLMRKLLGRADQASARYGNGQ